MKKLNEGVHDTEFSTVNLQVGPAVRCPQCNDIVGSLTWQPPFQGELELHGKAFGDLLKGAGDDLLVTEHFAAAFTAEGLKGLSGFHPVEVKRVRKTRRGPKPGPPPEYLVVTPAYGQPALDLARSRLHTSAPVTCTWCRSTGVDAVDGLALEEGTWTGEDVFRPRGLSGVILVSERFVRFAQHRALSHFTFVPIEKYVWDPLGHFYPWEQQHDPPGKS
ncbi:MAG TPA: hypothetical protein VF815_33155 [Myxococcaceae bacterium]